MKIKTAEFIKGVVKADSILENGIPQIAFIGRSNVGKSSVINSITNKKGLARTSSTPGRTQEINVFLINGSYYLIDLPGYGYAKTSKVIREKIQNLIHWYILDSGYEPKQIVHIIDAKVGPTDTDMDMLYNLETKRKNIIIVANKVDKIKSSESQKKMKKTQALLSPHKIIPFSSTKKIGISELCKEITK